MRRRGGPNGGRAHVGSFISIALLVVVFDLITKNLAVVFARGVVPSVAHLERMLRFTLFHNDAFALGFSLGRYTWPLNLGVMVATIVLLAAVCRALGAIDATAPWALGLIGGGALGNLTSLVISPAGVPDFVALAVGDEREIIFNVADVATYLGLLLLCRTAWVIFRMMRGSWYIGAGA